MSVLPPSRPEPPQPPGAHVVDAAVLAERRARRAEVGERQQAQRAQEAEEALGALEAEVDGLELRLGQAIEAHRHLEEQLSTRERELRGARQEAYAEQRLRLETTERAAELARGDTLARRLREAELRSAALEADLEDARRQTAEAAQAIAVAEAARRRAQGERDALRQAGERERERFDAIADEVENRVATLRQRLDGELAGLREQLTDERAARRALEAELEVERRRGAARHGDALEAAEAAAVLQEELAQRSALQSGVERVVDGLQSQLDQLADVAADGRRRQAHAQALLTAAVGDVRDALLSAEARVAEAELDVVQNRSPDAAQALAPAESVVAIGSTGVVPRLGGPGAGGGRASAAGEDPSAPTPPVSAVGEDPSAPTPPVSAVGEDPSAPTPPAPGARAAQVSDPGAVERGDWLRSAVVALAGESPSAAMRLIEAILPACLEPVAEILPCVLELPDAMLALSPPGTGRPPVQRLPEPRADARVHVVLGIEPLAALLAGEPPRRLVRRRGPARVLTGGRRRARRLGGLGAASLGLAALHRAGVYLDPGLAYAALGHAIDPCWTERHALCVGQEVLDDPSGPWYVTVGSGERLRVVRERPARVDALVRTTRATFLALLAGEASPGGPKPSVRGDLAAVRSLKGLTDRAQGLV